MAASATVVAVAGSVGAEAVAYGLAGWTGGTLAVFTREGGAGVAASTAVEWIAGYVGAGIKALEKAGWAETAYPHITWGAV